MQAWIFDVDGVLVHLEKRHIVEKALLTHLLTLLERGDVVAFVSGRATRWQRENVVQMLEETARKQHTSLKLLDHVFISGEFGGTRIYFHEGHEHDEINKAHLIPQTVLDQLVDCVQPFLHDFVIEPKQTIFTVVTKRIETFSTDCPILVAKFQEVIRKHALQDQLEILADSIAINVKYKHANKLFATEQVLSWIKEKHQTIEHTYAFGDNFSDLEIGHELLKQDKPFTFVYVGQKENLPDSLPFPVTTTKELYDRGTLEYLDTYISGEKR